MIILKRLVERLFFNDYIVIAKDSENTKANTFFISTFTGRQAFVAAMDHAKGMDMAVSSFKKL